MLKKKKKKKCLVVLKDLVFYLKSCFFYVFILQILETKQPPVPKIESPEGYYEEAEPYDISVNGISQLRGFMWKGVHVGDGGREVFKNQ